MHSAETIPGSRYTSMYHLPKPWSKGCLSPCCLEAKISEMSPKRRREMLVSNTVVPNLKCALMRTQRTSLTGPHILGADVSSPFRKYVRLYRNQFRPKQRRYIIRWFFSTDSLDIAHKSAETCQQVDLYKGYATVVIVGKLYFEQPTVQS